MSWALLAAAALPYVVGSLQKKPKVPSAPAPVKLPDRSRYINSMLDSAYNTDSQMYRDASAMVQEQVNRALARQGLAGSSVGANVAASSQNRVAQAFIDEQLRRQQAALQAAQQYDIGVANVGAQNSKFAYDHAMAQYQADMARRAGVAQGIGALANTAANIYSANQADNRYERQRAQDRAWLSSMYGGAPAAPAVQMAPVTGYVSPYGAGAYTFPTF